MRVEVVSEPAPIFWRSMISGGFCCPWCSNTMSTYDPCCQLGDAYMRGRFEQAHGIDPTANTGRGGAQR